MAVPANFTTRDFTGKFTVANKGISDSPDEVLAAQGFGWLKRKAIGLAYVTLSVKNYKDANGVEHLDVGQALTGGIPANSEERALDWEEKRYNDVHFGHVIDKAKRVTDLNELDDDHLKQGWTKDSLEHGLIETYVVSDTPKSGRSWINIQVWGIEEINGERRFVRRIVLTDKDGKHIAIRMVFDYLGPL
ncbi:lccl domain-containing protein [Moniliophthora roreri]|uniref:Lccl domain-containing protein n=1 Tax=Moniliophthora roreri TaxID=221103 RepID=A0A0W0F5U4_MONRR|nr:lccl domain-containing protein [Moniliophthora roreri]